MTQEAAPPTLEERVQALEGQLATTVGSLALRLQELEENAGADMILAAGGSGGGGGAPSGPAGGALAGEYPNPTIANGKVGEAALAAESVSLGKLAAAVLARLVPTGGAAGNVLGWKASGEGQWVAGGGGGGLSQAEIEALFLTSGLTKWPHEATAIGAGALAAVTTGEHNVAVGAEALHATTTGSNNIAIGWQALKTATASTSVIAIGSLAMAEATASNNIAIGPEALKKVTSENNVAIGSQSQKAATTAKKNVAIGSGTLEANETGTSNVAIGVHAGNLTTGTGNVFIGFGAGSGLGAVSNTLLIANAEGTTGLLEGSFSEKTLAVNGALTSSQKWLALEALNAKLEAAGAPWGTPEVAVIPGGLVELRGALKPKEETPIKTILFTLPASCRPSVQRAVVTAASQTATNFNLIIKTTGEVELAGPAMKTTNTPTLDGVSFSL